MNLISSTASRGFSTSAWQALERVAVKRRSAATVLKLLTQLLQPVAATVTTVAAADDARLPTLSPGEVAMVPSPAIDAPFERWAALTDAYAEQFLRMQRGDKGAREKAMGLSHEMLRMRESMDCAA